MLERLVARSFRTLRADDVDRWMENWADDAVFEFPGEMPISGRYVCKPAIEAWWRRFFQRVDTW